MSTESMALIKRMIAAGYSDDEIINRIRCSPEAIEAVKRPIVLEVEKKLEPKVYKPKDGEDKWWDD